MNQIGSIPIAPAPKSRKLEMTAARIPIIAITLESRSCAEICCVSKKTASIESVSASHNPFPPWRNEAEALENRNGQTKVISPRR